MKKLLVLSPYSYPNAMVASHRYEQIGKYLESYGYKMEIISISVETNDGHRLFFMNYFNKNKISNIKKTWVKNRYPKISNLKFINKYREFLYFIFYGKYPRKVFNAIYKATLNSIKMEKPEIILATAPDGIPLAVAKKINKEYHLPVLVDFRDTLDEISVNKLYKKFLNTIAIYRENKNLNFVEGFLTVSEKLKERIMKRINREGIVLMNGFDPQSFKGMSYRSNKKLKLIYAGNFYIKDGRNPFMLFDALDIFLNKNPFAKIQVEFYGGTKLKKYYEGRLCEKVITEYDRIDHDLMLRKEVESDILLFFTNPLWKGILTGKLPEYLGTGRKILAIPGDYDIARKSILDTNTGDVVYDAEEGAKVIERYYKEWENYGIIKNNVNTKEIIKFSRVHQAKILSEFLNKII